MAIHLLAQRFMGQDYHDRHPQDKKGEEIGKEAALNEASKKAASEGKISFFESSIQPVLERLPVQRFS